MGCLLLKGSENHIDRLLIFLRTSKFSPISAVVYRV